MPKCVIKMCRNNTLTTLKKDGVTYHRFPVHEILREKWRMLVARERSEEFFKPNKSSVICSDHFLESDKYCTNKGYVYLKKSAIPHIIKYTDDSALSETRIISLKEEEVSDVHALTAATSKDPLSSITVKTSGCKSTLSSPPELDSVYNSLITSNYFKRKLKIYHQKLHFRGKQVSNLKKQNKRLIKANSTLREIVQVLEKKLKSYEST